MIEQQMERLRNRLLIITGTMGAGKTTVLGEASDILALRHIPDAAIDLDALGLVHIPSAPGNDVVMYRNLQSVCNQLCFPRREATLAGTCDGRPRRARTLSWRCFSHKHSRLSSYCKYRNDAAARPDARIRCIAARIRCSRRETERHP